MASDPISARIFLADAQPSTELFANIDETFAKAGFKEGFIAPHYNSQNRLVHYDWVYRPFIISRDIDMLDMVYCLKTSPIAHNGLVEYIFPPPDIGVMFVSAKYFQVSIWYRLGNIWSITCGINHNYYEILWERERESYRRFEWICERLHVEMAATETLCWNVSRGALLHKLGEQGNFLPSRNWPYKFDVPSDAGRFVHEPRPATCTCQGLATILSANDCLLRGSDEQLWLHYVPARGTSELASLPYCLYCGELLPESEDELILGEPIRGEARQLSERLQSFTTVDEVVIGIGKPNFELSPIVFTDDAVTGTHLEVNIEHQFVYTQMFETWIPIVRIFADGLITVLPAGKRIQ